MNLKVGGRYLDRYNNEWIVVGNKVGWTYPFEAKMVRTGKQDMMLDQDRIESYLPNGRWSNFTPAACDLIRELTNGKE